MSNYTVSPHILGAVLLLIVVLISVIVYLSQPREKELTNSILPPAKVVDTSIEEDQRPQKQSQYKYNYIPGELVYANEAKDKPIAIKALQKLLIEGQMVYTEEQLNTLPDYFVITLLEADEKDYDLKFGLAVILARMMHPDYKAAVKIVEKVFGDAYFDPVLLESNIHLVSADDIKILRGVLDIVPAHTYSDAADVIKQFRVHTLYSKEALLSNLSMIRQFWNARFKNMRA